MKFQKIFLTIISFSIFTHSFSQSISESTTNLCGSNTLAKSDVGYYTSNIKPTAFHQDNMGNTIMAHYYSTNNCHGYFGNCYYSTIIKSDNNGKFLWEMSFEKNLAEVNSSPFYGVFVNSITSDEEGNIYLAGNFGARTISFGSGLIPNEVYRICNRSFFAKLNSKDGKTAWVILDVEYNDLHSGGTDLKYHNGNIIAAYIQFGQQKLKLPDNTYFTPKGNHGILKISKEGKILDNIFIEFNRDLHPPGFINPDPASEQLGRSIAIYPKLDINKEGKILMCGVFRDSLYYNNRKANIKIESGKDPSFYTALINKDYTFKSVFIPFYFKTERSYHSDFSSKPRIALDDDDNIYQAINIRKYTEMDPISFLKIPNHFSESSVDASYIIKYNSDGKYIWHSKFSGKTTFNELKFNNGLIGIGFFTDEFKQDQSNIIRGYGNEDGFLIKLHTSKIIQSFAKFGSAVNDRMYNFSVSPLWNSIKLLGSTDDYLKYKNNKVFNESECAFVLTYPLNEDCNTLSQEKNYNLTNFKIWSQENNIHLESMLFSNSQKVKISLLDIQGKLIKSFNELPQSSNITLELDNKISGIYILYMNIDNQNPLIYKLKL